MSLQQPKRGESFVEDDGYVMNCLGRMGNQYVFRVGDTDRIIRHPPEKWEEFVKRDEVSLFARDARESTHWEGCWRRHHQCAIDRLEKIEENSFSKAENLLLGHLKDIRNALQDGEDPGPNAVFWLSETVRILSSSPPMNNRPVHNHGPDDGPGLQCGESLTGDCLRKDVVTGEGFDSTPIADAVRVAAAKAPGWVLDRIDEAKDERDEDMQGPQEYDPVSELLQAQTIVNRAYSHGHLPKRWSRLISERLYETARQICHPHTDHPEGEGDEVCCPFVYTTRCCQHNKDTRRAIEQNDHSASEPMAQGEAYLNEHGQIVLDVETNWPVPVRQVVPVALVYRTDCSVPGLMGDISSVVGFVLGWWPGLEDGFDHWPDPETKGRGKRVYEAAQRLRRYLRTNSDGKE